MATKSSPTQTPTPAEAGPNFGIQRLYVKDISFESPSVPQIFLEKWAPKVEIDLQTNPRKLDDQNFEVSVKVMVAARVEDKVAFVVEVEQAGIFTLTGFPEADLNRMLGSFCPSILFPYARQVCTDLVVAGGFPALYLSPVNFEVLYEQHQSQQEESQKQ